MRCAQPIAGQQDIIAAMWCQRSVSCDAPSFTTFDEVPQSVLVEETGYPHSMPKIVDKQKRRREIATTAMRLFSKRGFDKTSVREIASACGIAKGSIYDYFATKEDILVELVHSALEMWRDVVQHLRDKKAPPQELIRELLAETVVRMAKENSGLLIYVSYAQREGASTQHRELLSSIAALSAETTQTIASWLEQGKREGSFSGSISPEDDAALLMSAIDGLTLRHRHGLAPSDLSSGLHRFLDLFFQGLSA